MRVTLQESVLRRAAAAIERCESGDPLGAIDALGDLWPNPALENELLGEALLAVGTTLFTLAVNGNGTHDAAKDILSQAVRLLKKSGNPKAEVAEVWLANAYFRQGAVSEGLDSLESVISTSADPRSLLCASISKAFGLTQIGRFYEALRILNSAEPMLGNNPNHNGKFFNQRGVIFRKLNDVPNCLRDYKTGLYWFETAGNLRYEAAILNNLANAHSDCQMFEEAHHSVDGAIRIYQTLNDNAHLAQSKDTKATLYLKQGELTAALSCSSEAVRLLTGDDRCWLPEILITRGAILARMKSEKAKSDFLRAASEAELSGDFVAAGRAYLTLIEEVNLPVRERAEYYRLADALPVDSDHLRRCARKIIAGIPAPRHKDDHEREKIEAALKLHSGNVAKAAAELGLSAPGLAQKIERDSTLMRLRQKKRKRRTSLSSK